MKQIEKKILEILSSITASKEYTEEQLLNSDFLENNMLDSIEFVRLLVEIEDAFGVELDDELLVMDNMRTVSSISETLLKAGVNPA